MTYQLKIGCLMVTEGRTAISDIAIESYKAQIDCNEIDGTRVQAKLVIVCPEDELDHYQVRLGTKAAIVACSVYRSVQQRIDLAANVAFGLGCQLCTMWDDDDYAPPNRLLTLAIRYLGTDNVDKHLHKSGPWVYGESSGYFVNLRTLRGERRTADVGYVWGGTLSFNNAAHHAAGGFTPHPFPGQDKAFVDAVLRKDGVVLLGDERPPRERPVAFSHKKNVATWLQSIGTPMEDELNEWMPRGVFDAVKRGQQFLIERRIYPPGCVAGD